MRQLTLDVLHRLLERDLIQAGRLGNDEKGNLEFHQWPLSPSEVMTYIEEEWEAGGTVPEPWTVAQFYGTETAGQLLWAISTDAAANEEQAE
ncbi:MAG TPA: hypothetical protein VII06_29880 [Chloroflexota bacterium]